MSEKEAEEYANNNNIIISCDCNYYESKDDLKEAFLAGAEFGYNKANEWHYLKNGDYPPLETDVLICIKLLNNDKTVKIGSFQQGGGLLIEGFIISSDAAVAWQSLPNLPAKE